MLCVLVGGCAATQQPVGDSGEVSNLALEVERLRGEVARLAHRLESERQVLRTASVARAPGCPVPDVAAVETGVSVETELRQAQRALVRIIDRLDLSPEAKRELVMAARPARQLDDENPWVAAK